MHDPKGLLLGEMAVKLGFLTEAQLDACIQQQIDERYSRPLGQILMESGTLPPERLHALLEAQRAAIRDFERSAEYGQLFGKIALAKGFLTEQKLDQALRAQARKHARGVRSKLGQVMLEFGIITIAQFWEIIHEQGDFMCGTCGSRIQKPIFRGSSVVCEGCKSPAFQVTAESAGPKPRRRKADRR